MCSEYNGWPNYETWNANLWIDNEEGVYRTAWSQCRQVYDACREEELERWEGIDRMGETLEQLFVDVWFSDEEEASPRQDALISYLKMIEWNRIAEHYWEDISREVEEEEKDDRLAVNQR